MNIHNLTIPCPRCIGMQYSLLDGEDPLLIMLACKLCYGTGFLRYKIGRHD